MEDEEGSGHSGKETIESLDERGWETHRSATKSEASDESGDEHLYNTDHESDFDLDSVHGPLFRGQTRQLSQRVEKLGPGLPTETRTLQTSQEGHCAKCFARNSKRVPAAAGKDCHA